MKTKLHIQVNILSMKKKVKIQNFEVDLQFYINGCTLHFLKFKLSSFYMILNPLIFSFPTNYTRFALSNSSYISACSLKSFV